MQNGRSDDESSRSSLTGCVGRQRRDGRYQVRPVDRHRGRREQLSFSYSNESVDLRARLWQTIIMTERLLFLLNERGEYDETRTLTAGCPDPLGGIRKTMNNNNNNNRNKNSVLPRS